jgi:DNA polymerase-3 subunit delta'
MRESFLPTLLFVGPNGVGKRRTAMALAQAVNCEKPVSSKIDSAYPTAGRQSDTSDVGVDACGQCESCQRIDRKLHADVLLVASGENEPIKIEQIRPAIEHSSYRPFEGRRRCVIIDDADKLTLAAQSALLKSLEEPPSTSLFVLVSARPDTLLVTVRSRCPQFRFGPLTPAEIAAVLVRSPHNYSETDANITAASADGSLKAAVDANTDEVSRARDVAVRTLLALAAADSPKRRLACAQVLVKKEKKLDSAIKDRDLLIPRLRALTSILRDVGIFSVRGNDKVLANADLEDELQRMTRSYDSSRVIHGFSAVAEALGRVERRNANPKIVANWLVFQL